MTLKVYLLRHGETDFNKMNLEWGQSDEAALNDIGILQSEKLADRISKIKFNKIFSSDMKRAMQTAQIIAKKCKTEIIEDRRLREYDPGSVDPSSEKWMDKYNEMLQSGMSKYDIRPFGGENIWDLIKRTGQFLKDLEKETGTIAIIAHSGTNTTFINLSQGREKNDFQKIKQDNTCINILSFSQDKWNIELINDSSHIDEIIPHKKKYANQDEVKKQVMAKIRELLELDKSANKKLSTGGDFAKDEIGSYERPYKRYKGSSIEIYALESDFTEQKNWKIALISDSVKRYEIGTVVIENTKHKINLSLVKSLQGEGRKDLEI